MADSAQAGANFIDKNRRLLEGGGMPTFRGFSLGHVAAEAALNPSVRGSADVLREAGESERQVHRCRLGGGVRGFPT